VLSTAVALQFRFPQQQYFVTQASLFASAIQWLQYSHTSEYHGNQEAADIDTAWRAVIDLVGMVVRFSTAQWVGSVAAIIGAIGAWRDLAPNSRVR
jgi:hypothetical protein